MECSAHSFSRAYAAATSNSGDSCAFKNDARDSWQLPALAEQRQGYTMQHNMLRNCFVFHRYGYLIILRLRFTKTKCFPENGAGPDSFFALQNKIISLLPP